MEIVSSDQSSPFIAPVNTDAAYPSRIGEPSMDGPIVYPPPEPDVPDNVVPFQRETGIDPKRIPSLKEILGTPKAKAAGLGTATSMNVTTMQRLGETPTSVAVVPQTQAQPQTQMQVQAQPQPQPEKKGFSMPWWGTALLVAGVAAVAYSVAKSKGNNEPLVADMDDEEGEEEDEG